MHYCYWRTARRGKARQAAKGVCLAPILARTQGARVWCILGDAMMDAAITGDCSPVVQLSPDIHQESDATHAQGKDPWMVGSFTQDSSGQGKERDDDKWCWWWWCSSSCCGPKITATVVASPSPNYSIRLLPLETTPSTPPPLTTSIRLNPPPLLPAATTNTRSTQDSSPCLSTWWF